MSVHQRKDGRWFAKWQEEGHTKNKYFGRGDIARIQALQFDEDRLRRAGRLKDEAGLSVTEICQLYHLQHEVQESTAKSDSYRLTSSLLPALGHLTAETLSTQHLNDYASDRRKAGRKRRTIDREIDILKSAFNWAARQDPPLIVRNPLSSYRVPGKDDDDVPMPPSRLEIERILTHAPPHLIRAVIIRWNCGMRAGGELTRIRWSDVDLAGDQIRILSAKKGGPSIRYVPLSPMLKTCILKWREEDERVADNIDRLPLVHYRGTSVASLKRSWNTAKRKAGITRRLRETDIRHAMATIALREGADLKAVSEILGHSRVDTTLIKYQHVVKQQHRDAIGKIPELRVDNSLTTPMKIVDQQT